MLARALRAASSPGPPIPVLRDSRGYAAAVAGASFGGEAHQPRPFPYYQALFESLVAIFRCVTINATSVASGVLRFYRPIAGDEGEREELLEDHALVKLFRQPNRKMSGRRWIGLSGVYKELVGNAYSELVRGERGREKSAEVTAAASVLERARRPLEVDQLAWLTAASLKTADSRRVRVALEDELRVWGTLERATNGTIRLRPVREIWPLEAAQMTVLPSPSGANRYKLRASAAPIEFADDEIFHDIYMDDPNNPVYGIAPARPATRSIISDELLEKATNAILRNGAKIGSVLVMKNEATQEQVDAATAALQATYGGVENWGKCAVVAGGDKLERGVFTAEELEASATRDRLQSQIVIAFGLWPVIFGVGDQSWTRENATTQERLYQDRTVDPRGGVFAEQVTQLIPRLGIPDTDGVVAEMDYSQTRFARRQALEEAQSKATMVAGSILSPDEVRAELGYGPRPDERGGEFAPFPGTTAGQDFARSLTAGEPDTETEPTEPAKPGKVVDVTQETALNGAQVTAATAIVQAVALGQLPRDSGIGQLMVFFNLTKEQAEHIMGSVGAGFVPEVGAQEELAAGEAVARAANVLRLVARSAESDLRDALLDAASLDNKDVKVVSRLKSAIMAVYVERGEAAARERGVEFERDQAERAAELHTGRIVNSLNRGLIQLAHDVSTADDPQDTLRRWQDARNSRIDGGAIGIASGAASAGELDALKQAGVERAVWRTQEDAQVRPSHDGQNGRAELIGEEFPNGCRYPGDPLGDESEVIGCRCFLEAEDVAGEEISVASVDERRIVRREASAKNVRRIRRALAAVVSEQSRRAAAVIQEEVR